GPGAGMMFVEQTQQAEFIRLARCFEVGEDDVDRDRIEDASRLILARCLEDIEGCLAQMARRQCAFKRIVLHDQDKRGRSSARKFCCRRLRQHGDPFPHLSPIEDDDVIAREASVRKPGPRFPGQTARSVMPRSSLQGLPLVSSRGSLTKYWMHPNPIARNSE